jgi:predicted acetyltransferase
MPEFKYTEPGILSDGVIRLELKSYQEEVDLARMHVPYYEFDVISIPDEAKAGGLVLRAGYNPHVVDCAGNIGYGIDEAFRGRRYAARACVLVALFAGKIGMPYLVITTKRITYLQENRRSWQDSNMPVLR